MEIYKILPTGEVEKTIAEIKEVISAEKAQEKLTQLKKRVENCPFCKVAKETIVKLEEAGVKEVIKEP